MKRTTILLGLVAIAAMAAVAVSAPAPASRPAAATAPATGPATQPGFAQISAVPGRMVCSEACKAKLDQANGIRKCPRCGAICNVAHQMCLKCAKAAGACEVCGKKMSAVSQPASAPAT
jgi:hypothetical protein